MTLYHGSTLSIEHPLDNVGRADLDFGKGFYLTSLRTQAEQWASRIQLIRAQGTAWLNIYEFDKEKVCSNNCYRCLSFNTYDQQWLDFIIASRKGKEPWKSYDFIEGGVPNVATKAATFVLFLTKVMISLTATFTFKS